MNDLNIKPAWSSARRASRYLFGLSLAGLCLVAGLLASGVSAETGNTPPQAPVSLTDLGKFSDPSFELLQTNQRPSAVNSDSATDAPIQDITNSQTGAGQTAGQTDRQTDSTPPARQPSVTVGRASRRSISKIGLASIGLNRTTSADAVINSLIWSDSDAEQVLALLAATPAQGSSAALSDLTTAITVQTAVPPKHAGALAEQLIKARLDWLARSGQSDKLSKIVRLLPLDEEWSDWKRWQIEYDMVRRADKAACSDAERFALQTLDPFWHKARVICALLDGQQGAAGFAADILRASGEQDDNFFQLVDKLLGRTQALSLDPDNLSLLHLVLMDAAHEPISVAAFDNLPASMIQAASSFRYLAPDAALKTSYQMLDRSIQTSAETEQIWRSLPTAPVPAEAALASLNSQQANGYSHLRRGGLNSAYLWVGLATRRGGDTDMLIARALRREARTGRIDLLLDVYASLIRQRLDITETTTLPDPLAADYAVMLALTVPSQPLPPVLSTATQKAADIQALLQFSDKTVWDADLITRLDCWSLLPILEAMGVTAPSSDWVARLASQPAQTDPNASLSEPAGWLGDGLVAFHRLSPPGLLALGQAANAGRVGEVSLIAARLVQPFHLGWIAPSDGGQVITALRQVGLDQAASALARELLTSYLLRFHFTGSES